jgi:hypothetical protein
MRSASMRFAPRIRHAEVRPVEVRLAEDRVNEVRPNEVRTDIGILLTPLRPSL